MKGAADDIFGHRCVIRAGGRIDRDLSRGASRHIQIVEAGPEAADNAKSWGGVKQLHRYLRAVPDDQGFGFFDQGNEIIRSFEQIRLADHVIVPCEIVCGFLRHEFGDHDFRRLKPHNLRDITFPRVIQ